MGLRRNATRWQVWALGGLSLAQPLVVGTVALAACGLALAGAVLAHDSSTPRNPPAVGLSALPQVARGAVARELARSQPGYRARSVPDGYLITNDGARVVAGFSARGPIVEVGGVSWSLGLTSWGYDRLHPTARARPVAQANQIVYARTGIDEWYANGALGLEQGFTVFAPPPGHRGAMLTLSLGRLPSTASGQLGVDHRSVLLESSGRPVMRYGGLYAGDARGRNLPARIDVRGDRVLLRIDDRGARYPLRVDPFVRAAKLTASDGAQGDLLGYSVAISGDGSTIVAGAPYATVDGNAKQGAAYVFVKPSSGWANASEAAKLTASDGAAGDALGLSAAVSADGSTVVVGASGTHVAAYVYVRPPTGWASATEKAKLTPSDGTQGDNFASSVAISGDGSTIAVGAYGAAPKGVTLQGIVYVYAKPAGQWANATEIRELTAPDGIAGDQLGHSVALSGDGSTIAAGAYQAYVANHVGQGAVYAFTRSGAAWTGGVQSAKLTAADGAAHDSLGNAVAISSDGSTVAAGAPWAAAPGHSYQGALYVFVRPTAGGWTDSAQNGKLTANDDTAYFPIGFAAAASADGSAILGGAYVFTRPAGGWSDGTQSSKLSTGDDISEAVAISADGATVAAGARGATVGSHSQQGAAYVLTPGSEGGGGGGCTGDGRINIPNAGTPPPSLRFLYWGDTRGCELGRALVDAPFQTATLLIGVTEPCAVAVDGKHLYWSDGQDSIGRTNLDGSGLSESFITGVSAGSCGVAIDSSYLYWADWAGGSIGRANLDGTGANPNFITGVSKPCGLAVDGTHVYWTSMGTYSIGRANVNGSAVEPKFILTGNTPCGVAVDSGHVYWDNWGGTTIGRANLDGSSASQTFITGALYPCGVAVDSGHIYWVNYGDGNVSRANLDGSSATSLFRTDAGACGIALSPEIASSPPPPGSGPSSTLFVGSAPRLTALSETNRVFAPDAGSTPLRASTTRRHRPVVRHHPRGTTFSFNLDRPATVSLVIDRQLQGRRAGRRCVPPSQRLRTKPHCLRTVRVAGLLRHAHTGANRVHFTGRVSGRALAPGIYAVIVTAANPFGQSRAQTLTFTVVAP